MIRWLKRNQPDPNDLVHERWELTPSLPARLATIFSLRRRKQKYRFREEDAEKYTGRIVRGRVELVIKKPHVFAWIIDPWYRYRDLMLEAEVSFGPGNGHSSVGFLIKHATDENYYYFLVSNQGYFRFDVVFNGNPMTLIPWCPCTLPQEETIPVRIIVYGTHFSFFLDNEWVGELDSDTIETGGISFAGQNYEEAEQAEFTLHHLVLESRPVEVEKHYQRWNEYIPALPDNRMRLATVLYNQRQYAAAVVQLKKTAKQKLLSTQEFLMLGDSLMNMELYSEALESMEKALEREPHNREALVGKAELLYLLNRFLELKDFLETYRKELKDNPVLLNLLGNAYFSLGQWEEAMEPYEKAASEEPEMPLFAVNTARCCEQLDMNEKALDYYLQAARVLFRQEAYNDLSGVLSRILYLDSENQEARALQAKMLFHEESFGRAGELFRDLCDEEYEDSSIYFLFALIKRQNGEDEQAIPLFERAIELEPDSVIYRLRYGEHLHVLGEDVWEHLEKALELAAEDPWVLNFAGIYFLDHGQPQRALQYLEKAHRAEPEAVEIIMNYSRALFETGGRQRAFALLREHEEHPEVSNQLGNFLVAQNQYERAGEAYERALQGDPDNPDYLENCAAVYLECDQINRAEDLLAKCLEIADQPTAYNLMGNIATIKGEYKRAEAAYRECLRYDPENTDCAINLAELYITLLDYDQARRILHELREQESISSAASSRVERLLTQIQEASEKQLLCAECGRQWWVPRTLGEQPPVKLRGEPPGEAPAGKCPRCGKILCISCASQHLREKRFVCPDCNEYLKLSDDELRYLVLTYVEKQSSP